MFSQPSICQLLVPLLFVATNAMVMPQQQSLSATSSPCQCSVVASTNSTLRLQIESTTNVFVIELNELQRDFTSTAKHTINVDNQPLKFDLSHHKWMSGSVLDHLGSTARVHVDTSTPNLCDGVSGALHLANEIYVLEQVKGELRIKQQSDILAQAEAFGYKCEHQNTDDADSTNDQDTDRQRRTDIPKRACEVFLDADLSFFEQWKGDCRTDETPQECLESRVERVTIKMVDALHMVDEIYRSNEVVGAILELHLAGTHIHTGNHFAIDGTKDADDALQLYEDWLDGNHRGEGVPTSDSVCLNHLFTNAQFENKNHLGIASQGGRDFQRKPGVCGYGGMNSGLSTSTFHSTTMEHWMTVRVIAHGIGHNLGASHDDDNTCGSGFLMNAYLNTQRDSVNLLSQCSSTSIFSTISQLEDNSWRRARMCLTEIENTEIETPTTSPTSTPLAVDAVKEGGACGFGFNDLPNGFFGDCEDGLVCKCVGYCADANYADVPSTCVSPSTSPTSSPTSSSTPSPTFQIVSRICRKDEYDVTDSSKDETPNNAITTLEGKTVDQCVKSCAEEPKCSGFNHNALSLQCELKFSDFATNDLVVQPGVASTWKYYRMTEDCHGDCPDNVLERFVKHSHMKDQDAGHRIKRIPNINKKTCAKKCEQRTACFAFNHRQNNPGQWDFACQLLEAPDVFDFTYHTATAPENMWRYYRMKSSCANEKYDMLLEERQALF